MKENPIIVIDDREESSECARFLSKSADVSIRRLEIGDYILSGDVGVERKTASDFIKSLTDGRLFEQVRNLRDSYKKPLIIVEGENLREHGLRPNAVMGAITSIMLDWGTPIIFSRNPKESAEYMHVIAKREQEARKVSSVPHSKKKISELKLQQEYIVASLPGIGSEIAKKLLIKFKSIGKIFSASKEELLEVEKIGEKKAKRIRGVIEAPYGG